MAVEAAASAFLPLPADALPAAIGDNGRCRHVAAASVAAQPHSVLSRWCAPCGRCRRRDTAPRDRAVSRSLIVSRFRCPDKSRGAVGSASVGRPLRRRRASTSRVTAGLRRTGVLALRREFAAI
jgi:hypothetical protein